MIEQLSAEDQATLDEFIDPDALPAHTEAEHIDREPEILGYRLTRPQ